MADYTNFFPIVQRTEEDLRADFDVRANAGLTVDDPDWADTRVGSPYWLATQPAVIEFAVAYDRINEAVAAGILATSWGDALDAHAASYGEERTEASYATGEITFTGDEGTLIGTGVRVSPVQTDPDVNPPIFETTASGAIDGTEEITLPIQAIEAGEDGNVAANEITLPITGVEGLVSLTNADPTDGGADEESDEALKERLMLRFRGGGRGTSSDYAAEALRQPTVGKVTIQRAWDGPGTVRIMVMDDNGDPLSVDEVADLQEHFEAWVPLDHEPTVATPTTSTIHSLAEMEFKEGYSLDGSGGDVALQTAIEEAIAEYINSLGVGEDVIYNRVIAAIMTVEGVLDVNDTVRIEETTDPPTGTTDIAIGDTEVAKSGNITLTEA